MVKAEDFSQTLRSGGRGGNRFLVVTIAVPTGGTAILRTHNDDDVAPRIGLIVAKKQFPRAVDRNRVKRKLRHLMVERVGSFPPGTTIVVRALAPALRLSSSELGQELDGGLRRAATKAGVDS